jgi:hypothetical protein
MEMEMCTMILEIPLHQEANSSALNQGMELNPVK